MLGTIARGRKGKRPPKQGSKATAVEDSEEWMNRLHLL